MIQSCSQKSAEKEWNFSEVDGLGGQTVTEKQEQLPTLQITWPLLAPDLSGMWEKQLSSTVFISVYSAGGK